MEYITNGYFKDELNNGWATTYPVERRIDEQAGEPDERFFVHFGAGGQIAQSFALATPRPGSVKFSRGIQVKGGDNKPNGNVQLTVMSQSGTDPWQYRTYPINEFQTWQTIYLVLPVDKAVDRMGVILTVVRGFNEDVSMRKVSFADATDAYASGVGKKYRSGRPDVVPDDFS